MPVFDIKPKDLGKALLKDWDERLRAGAEAVHRAVALHGPRIAQATVATATPPPVDRGTYRRSFKVQKTPTGAIFYNFSPHAPVIEDGRRPGARMPPVSVILAWVKRKRIGASLVGPVRPNVRVRSTTGGKARTIGGRRGAVDRQQYGIALSIARSIKWRGLKGHRVLAITEAVLTPIVAAEIDAALARV